MPMLNRKVFIVTGGNAGTFSSLYSSVLNISLLVLANQLADPVFFCVLLLCFGPLPTSGLCVCAVCDLGIGFEAAKVLAANDGHVIIATRDP